MIKAVICDMDGVLIDTEKYLVKYWIQAGQEAGYDFRREHALMLRSLNAHDAILLTKSIFGDDYDHMAVRARRKELVAGWIGDHGVEIKPYVPETLDALRRMGFLTAVATATDLSRASDYLTQVGLLDRFDRIICASMVPRGKPHPDIYLYVCEQLGLDPSECIAVEDSPNGIRSAAAAGLVTVMVPDLTQPDEDLMPYIDYVAQDFSGLLNIVEQSDIPNRG